jgi:hypothetical protein
MITTDDDKNKMCEVFSVFHRSILLIEFLNTANIYAKHFMQT